MADTIQSADIPSVHGLVALNPDGSAIGGGSSSGVAAYSDSGNTDRKGLVDADRHVQVDVLTMPAVVDQIELNQDSQTALLTTIDADTSNLAGILSDTTGILADTAAIQTAVEALDNAVDGNYLNVNMNVAGTDAVSGSGTATGAIRVELPTNGTGVVGLNAGTNNIGDVDVLTLPRSQSGPGQPGTAVDSYTQAAINLAAGANQVLVSSAANKQIWVYGITFTVNVAGTVSFQDEDDTAITGIMNFDAKSGMAISPSGNFSMPIWKLATDKDLEVDVVTSELDGYITYAIVSV